MGDLTFLPAVVMAPRIRPRKNSPRGLGDAHLVQIERVNPNLNAFVHVDAERVRREASEAEAAVMSGKTLGPLHGVPISIKSSLDVAGVGCGASTRPPPRYVAGPEA